MRCEYVSWQKVYGLCELLCRRMLADGFRPDAIVGIARGGYTPARILADFFGVMNLAALKVEHYHGTRKSPQARIAHALPEAFGGSRVLLVDDVSDSGDTFDLALAHLAGRDAVGEVRTAVLHHKTTSSRVPDYLAHRVVAWRWIIYPWALAEDLQTLGSQLWEVPDDVAALGRRLHEAYGLRIPRNVLASVLDCMRGRQSSP
jgi:hypoxanthine phosphoribosyltransferase